MEVTFDIVDCLLCDAKFSPVTLAPESDDEKLLDIFCHYFELSPKEVASFYDERVGFPFCDTCRGVTLCSLSRLHDNLTLIHNEINQLVTNVCHSIVNIVSRINFIDSHPSDYNYGQGDNSTNSFSRGAIASIRKSITSRLNPQVSLIRLDFQRLHRQCKNLQKKKKTKKKQQVGGSSLEPEEFINHIDPSAILGIASDGIIKNEPSSPSFLHNVDPEGGSDQHQFEYEYKVVENDSVNSENFSVSRYGRKRKQTMQTKSDSDLEFEFLSDREKLAERREEEEDDQSKEVNSNKRLKKRVVKNKPTAKKRGRPRVLSKKPSSPEPDPEDPDFNPEAEEAVQTISTDEDEDSEKIDGDGSSKSKKSPVKTGPRKMGRPKKGFELNQKLIPKKWKWGCGNPRERERYHRDKLDPIIEVEPNLFRRKESGWSFRIEEIEGVEMFVCLAEGCQSKYLKRNLITHHISLMHMNTNRLVCPHCERTFWKQNEFDEHACNPATPVCRKTQNFGNGQYIYDGIWPFYEVDLVENGGCDLKCGTCGSLQREQARMTQHIKQAHCEQPKFSCEICCRTFVRLSALRKHLVSHSDSKEAVCDQCGEFFKNQGTLRAHVTTKHERGPKSFKCDFPNCGRAFSQVYGLYRHRKTAGHPKPVNPEQPRYLIDPLNCPLCDKKFVLEKTFNTHREKCRGKKEYVCPICQTTRSSSQGLRMHMAFLHKDEYMNYPEGRYKTDSSKTSDEAIAKLKQQKNFYVKRRDKRRADTLKKTLEKVKLNQLNKQNEPASSS